MNADPDDALTEAEALGRDRSPIDFLTEWLVPLIWKLRVWRDPQHCVVEARFVNERSMLVRQLGEDLDRAKAAGAALPTTDANEVFELATALSCAVGRFRIDKSAVGRRVEVATAGSFVAVNGRS